MSDAPSTRQLWVWAVVLPGLLYLSQTMCVWESPRFLGELAFCLMTAAALLVLPILASPFIVIYCVCDAMIHRKNWSRCKQSLASGAAWICFAVLSGFAIKYAQSHRHSTFARATHSGAMVIEALAKFHRDHGQYPDQLAELVPKYLESVPYTGLIAYPEFRYTKDRNDLEVRPGQYELRINCSSGGINFDRFVYWPSEKYPDRIQGNGISRIGAWAYLHE